MNNILVGNAPCSWGVVGIPAPAGETAGYVTMLDELTETGYTGTELGDYGFMPTDPVALRGEMDKRNLTMIGAFVGIAFKYPEKLAEGEAHALTVAKLLAEESKHQMHKPFINLADGNAEDPVRTHNAGRITPAMGLTDREWEIYAKGVTQVARAIKQETGLPVLFHHHTGGFIETPAEITCLLSLTDPADLGLCFDTGHYAYGTGNTDPQAIIEGMNRYADRIQFVHFKDCEPRVSEAARRGDYGYDRSIEHGLFCELGKGYVNFPAVLAWLRARNYSGWVLVEQDVLPGMGTPKESARRNREYLRSIGI